MAAHPRKIPDDLDQAKTEYEDEAGENDQQCQEMHTLHVKICIGIASSLGVTRVTDTMTADSLRQNHKTMVLPDANLLVAGCYQHQSIICTRGERAHADRT